MLSKDFYTNSVEGMTSRAEINFLNKAAKNYDLIVEIGSWKGKSTVALLDGCPGKVIAVDHFKGTKGENTREIAADGSVYREFLKNTKNYKNLLVLKKDSLEAVKNIGDIDMIFIDGDHSYEAIKNDIEFWLPKTQRLICGHDYHLPGVKRAVDEKFSEIKQVGYIWYKFIKKEDFKI